MRTGSLAGQADAIRERVELIKENERARSNRRSFLSLIVGVAGGTVVGKSILSGAPSRAAEPDSTPRSMTSSELDWARRLATGPLDDLLRAQVMFTVHAKQAAELDEDLDVGITRLASAFVERDPRCKPQLGRAILLLDRRDDLSPCVRRWMSLVREHGR